MSSLARVVNNSCSSTTLNYAKNINVLARKASHLEMSPRRSEQSVPDTRNVPRGNLLPWNWVKHPANFIIHPEKLRSIIKEKDAQILCNFMCKEGFKKRKKCLAYIEKKRKLMRAFGIDQNGQYAMRTICTSVRRPNPPKSYTSFVNSQLRSNPNVEKKHFGVSASKNHTLKETPKANSSEGTGIPKYEVKEIFLNFNSKEGPSQQKYVPTIKPARKEKKLKPLQIFRKTRYLPRSSALNLPADPLPGIEHNIFATYPSVSNHDSKVNIPPFSLTETTGVLSSASDEMFVERRNDEATIKRKNGKHRFTIDKSSPYERWGEGKSIREEISLKKKHHTEDRSLIDNVLTLFNKVKSETKNRKSKGIQVTASEIFKDQSTETESLRFPSGSYSTETYKIVNALRTREFCLRNQFRQMGFCTHITIPKKEEDIPGDRREQNTHYLIRLPKTTPEGYRALLYAVRDNDPTKMNFSDCIKGFCMYNDCILSEDGLQEGYIVLFDMKGVQLGHLARVSLPALRCFMLYIQEAHPCRLKAIHVLNTASWIHHVMRLIVPLVRSELLNLVQFHKGNIPDGFPTELLPTDYGGEAPNMEDLDRETKSLVSKYHEWLIESADWKSDESLRVKKASWWGLFNGSNKTNNVELDEKTILKNLQID